MSIQNYLNQIKNAVFGKDVRQSIHDAIKQCYDDASINHDNANMEVKLARGSHDTLNERFTSVEENIKNNSEQLDTIEIKKASKVEVETLEGRVNNLTKLEEGSTTGDAELIDTRVMNNGEIAENAGSAIRNQVGFLGKSIDLKAEASGLESTVLDIRWQSGKYDTSTGSAIENNSMNRTWRFNIDGILELKINNPNDYTLYHYFLYDDDDTFLSSGNIKSEFIIKHSGKIAFDTAKVSFPSMIDKVDETKSNFIFTAYSSKINDVEENLNNLFERKNIDLEITNGKYVVGNINKDTNSKYFSTQKIILKKGSKLSYTDSKYVQVELAEFNSSDFVCSKITATRDKNISKDGVYALQGYINVNTDITEEKIQELMSDIQVLSFETTTGLPPENDGYQKNISYKPLIKENSIETIATVFDYYKYPLTPIWGHEYLQHWYEKIYDGTNNVTIALDGDSITQGYEPKTSVQDTFFGMRDWALKKIMKAGNFDLTKLTIKNNGYGGRNTNEWVGNSTYGMPTWISQFPNGFLNTSMSCNPDLLIIAYGMNDADKTHSMFAGLTLEQRLNLFRTNMEEGLQRIRGNSPVNGRPAYNKSLKDLSIIICLPTVGTVANTGRTYLEWFQNVRPIVQELCRKYQCAFADLTARTYAHNDIQPKIWSALNSDGASYDQIHPNKYSNAQIMSQLQDLVYPICMWNIDVE